MAEQTVADVVAYRRSDELISVPASSSVAEAVAVMVERDVGAVLVATEDRLVAGIFSERDLLVRVVREGLDPALTPLSMVMTRDVRFVSPGTTTVWPCRLGPGRTVMKRPWSPSVPSTERYARSWGDSTSIAASSTTSPRRGDSQALASNPLSIQRHWKKALPRPPWLTTLHCFLTPE